MEKNSPKLQATVFSIILFLSSATFLPGTNSEQFSRTLSKKQMGLKREKLSHFRFYLHDIVSGKNPTAVQVAGAAVTNTSATGFGALEIFDDPFTEGPNSSSKLVGRAQGMYASADIDEIALLMAVNYVFVEGKYNGSTLSVMGRTASPSKVREMPIVGGSGVFRYARGYVESRTNILNLTTGDSVIEYNFYVLHYF